MGRSLEIMEKTAIVLVVGGLFGVGEGGCDGSGLEDVCVLSCFECFAC